MQFAEGLSDRQVADAVRSRIDWKYALDLELEDPGFDFSVLSEFRSLLLEGGAEQLLLEKLLEECKNRGLLKARSKQRTDSTRVLAAVKAMGRLECIGETLRAALNAVATVAPGWLRGWAPPDWYERYGPRVQEYRLPRGDAQRKVLAEQIGADGFRLLVELDAEGLPEGASVDLRDLEAVRTLRRVWAERYHRPAEDGGVVRLRGKEEIPPVAEVVQSPHDTEARYSWKREVNWVGFKVHFTETCEEGGPNLITHVETTPSTQHTTICDRSLAAERSAQHSGPGGPLAPRSVWDV
jgi:transposase